MAKAVTLKPSVAVAGTVLILCVANWLSVQAVGYPFLHCWLTPVLWPIYEGWYQFINVVLIGFLLFYGMRQKWASFMTGALLLGLVTGIPQFANILFRLGGSCG